MSGQPKTAKQLFVGYALDIVLPILTYAICSAFGVAPMVAMIGGATIALGTTILNSVRNKKVDRLGIIVILEIAASIWVVLVTGDQRLMLAKPAAYTLIVGVYLIATSFKGRPMSYEGVKGMATQGEQARSDLFDRTWETSAEFRKALRTSSLGWGFAFIVDSVLRVVVVFSLPVKQVMVWGYIPHVAAMAVLMGFSALMGKTTKRILEAEEAKSREN